MAGADLMVKEVEWPALKTFELKPYFWVNEKVDPTEVIFRAPVGGATTENSDNPRSECRQMWFNGDPASWSNRTATWNMEAVMRFRAIPTDSDPTRATVGMQIHGGDDDVTVLRLEKNGDLWATDGDTAHGVLITGSYVMNTWMKVRIEARKGGGFRWYVNDVPEATIGGTTSGAYFKWGAYAQIGPNSTGYGETGFRSVKVWKT